MSDTAARPTLADCARTQLRVIGALVIREMHTRFGRHRFGYLTLFFEPLLLAIGVGIIHQLHKGERGVRGSFEMYAIGYVLFMKLRQMIMRAHGTIPSNAALLFHRQVALPDLFFARHLIETAACTGVLFIMTFAGIAMGGEIPDSPIKMLAAAALMFLLAQGLALMVGAATAEWHGVERFIHLLTYLFLPISGLFFMLYWLPPWLQDLAVWVPTVHIFELLRDGQFGEKYWTQYDILYVIKWILVTHLIGLAGLRIVRQRVGLE